ncbi:MAG: AlpA family phage regulatory protein [Pseudomonadota bacterium]|jgi:prophage regulatory protein|nr:AlpA family phage regulatory protein [Pseudomonadota bacterium]
MTSPSRKILRLPAVMAKTGLGRDSIYRGGREGWFPPRIKLTARASGWFEDEVDNWLAERAAERERAA